MRVGEDRARWQEVESLDPVVDCSGLMLMMNKSVTLDSLIDSFIGIKVNALAVYSMTRPSVQNIDRLACDGSICQMSSHTSV
jgi:hypothetical protein